MAYGTALARAYYGAGDFHTALALKGAQTFRRGVPRPAPRPRMGYARGYYSAGGFFSKLAKNVGKIGKAVATVGTGFATGGVLGAIKAGAGLYAGGAAAAKVPSLGGTGIATGLMPFAASRGGLGKYAGSSSTRRTTKKRRKKRATRRKRRGSSYRRGDWGDDGGRDKHGHFLNERGGHHNFKRRRRRRGGRRGGKVSFTTKSGKKVSFLAKTYKDGTRIRRSSIPQ